MLYPKDMEEKGFSYRSRIVDSTLRRKLKGKGAVLIEGPKWCGKTTTAEQFARSILSVDDPATVDANRILSEIDPEKLLDGEQPRLLDEWQVAPKLWDAVRHHVDHHKGQGQFILTGSSVPADISETIHSGTGRFSWLVMRPMTLFESGDSTGDVSLASLFESGQVSGCSDLNIDRLAFLVCRGGWPESIDMDEDVALDQAFDYIDAVIRTDMSRVDGVGRDPQKVRMLLRSYARNQGSQISQAFLSAEISSDDRAGVSEETVSEYLKALRKLHIVEDMGAWNPNLRSKTAVRTSDTRYFVDPSLAAASLRIGPKDLINDLNTFGFFFEALVIRDLRVYAESLDGDVYHYRDNMSNECDAVIHLRDGRYALLEVKLGGSTLVNEGAEALKKVLRRIDTDRMGTPAFMAVVTGTDRYAYRRDDGVLVVPIGALKNRSRLSMRNDSRRPAPFGRDRSGHHCPIASLTCLTKSSLNPSNSPRPLMTHSTENPSEVRKDLSESSSSPAMSLLAWSPATIMNGTVTTSRHFAWFIRRTVSSKDGNPSTVVTNTLPIPALQSFICSSQYVALA